MRSMEVDVLKETVKELDQSAKLIRDLVSDLIKLRRSLLKAYSGLSKLVEEPELLKPAAPPTPQPSMQPLTPPPPIQQAEVTPPTPPATVAPPTPPPTVASLAPPVAPPEPVHKVAVEGEIAAFVTALSESIKSDPRTSNVIKKLGELREKVEKKYVYHPVISEIKLVASKLQSMPGDSILSGDNLSDVLEKLSEWASRLS
ncbi:MAG: hypothetical protein KIH01_00360 [Candidatus Freyarchaeota archaeon]|nr:hypothetical protein [Candidatus Jordarchaeia archaeon]